jgi:hypothetical protein
VGLIFAFTTFADDVPACTKVYRNIDRKNEIICFIDYAFLIIRAT